MVKESFPSLSGRQIEEAIERGLVTDLHGKPVKKGHRVSSSSEIDCKQLEAHLAALRGGNPALSVEVLSEAPEFLVVDKPAGMPSHPLSLFDGDTITQWLFAKYPDVSNVFGEAQPTVAPHRLDTGTSGLLVVAKSPDSFAAWRERFQKKRMSKRYLAWCWGKPSEDSFEVNYAIAHSKRDRRLMALPALGEPHSFPVLEAQSLVTVRFRNRAKGIFLAEVQSHSGVTHQVRVHLAGAGYPLLGDSSYDGQYATRAVRPAHHELRASELEGDGFQFRAPTEAFSALYRS